MGTRTEISANGGGGVADRLDVLVVDDYDASRLGLALLLRRQPWVRSCALAADRRQATEAIGRARPDVAVVDISNEGPFVGLAIEALRASHPGLRVLLIARCASVSTAALRHVRARFLPVGTPMRAVVEAVLEVARGGEPAPATAPSREVTAGADAAPAAAATAAPGSPGSLTAREREVLDLLATGATNREIAAQLHLGADSVKKHASAIYRKLGVRNRTEATQYARNRA